MPGIDVSADGTPSIGIIFKFDPKADKPSDSKGTSAGGEYDKLIATVKGAGLAVVGKGTSTSGTVLVLVETFEPARVQQLIQWERSLYSAVSFNDSAPPSRASLLRALYTFVTTPTARGGLGISPGSSTWPHVATVFSPHPRTFKRSWIQRLKSELTLVAGYSHQDVLNIGALHGEPAALYFGFLSSFTRFLLLPAVLGAGLFFEQHAFVQPLFSVFIVLFSAAFIERWRRQSAKISAQVNHINENDTSSAQLTRLTSEYAPIDPSTPAEKAPAWWLVELKTLISTPLILFGLIWVGFNMSVAFLLEAFVSRLYDGPLKIVAPLIPTVYNVALVPPFVAIYSAISEILTSWEGHATQHGHDSSLAFKLVPVNSMVSFWALALSAGVYIPFGQDVMSYLHTALFDQQGSTLVERAADAIGNITDSTAVSSANVTENRVLGVQRLIARAVPLADRPLTTPETRLSEQLFSFTLILQLFPIVLEVTLPFVLRFAFKKLAEFQDAKKKTPSATKGVEVVQEKGSASKQEREWADQVVAEASLPEHRFFHDYLTLSMQFGYFVLWSTSWTLTPAVILLLAVIRLRTDALKTLVHFRRTIPTRGASDSANVWIRVFSILTWVAALVNAFLIAVVRPLLKAPEDPSSTRVNLQALVSHAESLKDVRLDHVLATLQDPSSLKLASTAPIFNDIPSFSLIEALLALFAASYGLLVFQWYVGHLFGTVEKNRARTTTSNGIKIVPDAPPVPPKTDSELASASTPVALNPRFWQEDEGSSEIVKKNI